MDEKYQTLGDNVVPTNYNITMDTNLKTFRFNGIVRIKVRIRKPTRVISLNSVGLKILGADVSAIGAAQSAVVTESAKEERISLNLKKAVSGNAIITVRFSGTNNDKMHGFSRSRYMEGGKEQYLLTSQFEAADARAAFPCFDEPNFKATFDLTMLIDKGLEAVSNMPIKRITPSKGRQLVSFHTTPRMSCYLLYLGVGRYAVLEGKVGKTKIRVMAVPGKKGLERLPMEYAKRSIAFLEKYFGIRYPLPKVDLLAIPDFSAGAMENWVAITFRENALLGDEKHTPVAVKQRIAEVIAHELVHQWFGDLVTMKWWNDIWLNESFATFMANKTLDALFPEWDMKKQYFDDVIATAYSADSLKSTHPISVMVSTPGEIDQIFDNISYEKGGTVLHMLENYAGAEGFRKGLHLYLTRHAYGNATKYDLWDAMDKAARKSGRSISKFASIWVDTPGYPIVEISHGSGGRLLARQRRFLLVNGNYGKKTLWPIPMPYMAAGQGKGSITLNESSIKLPVGNDSWLKLNLGQHYLYRVRYPREQLDALGKLMRSGKIKGADAWGVENDLFVLARCGRIKLPEYLKFIDSYCMNPDYPLSFGVSSHLEWFEGMLYGTSLSEKVEKVSMRYHLGMLGRLGWAKKRGEDSIQTMSRSMAVSSLGRLGHKHTIAKALSLFSTYAKGGNIDPDLKGAVSGIAAWNGNTKTYNKMVALYRKQEMPDDKIRFLQCLALFRDRRLLKRTLRFAFSKDVRLQDSYMLPAIISSNPVGRRIIWPWTKRNWPRLMRIYNSGTHMLERYASNLSGAAAETERQDIRRFFSNRGNRRTDINLRVKQSLERISANINFMRANGLAGRSAKHG